MKNLSILGATGSIGDSTLKVLDNLKDHFKIIYLSANNNYKKLADLAKKYNPEYVIIDKVFYKDLKGLLSSTKVKVLTNEDGLLQATSDPRVHVVVNAIVGSFGLRPTITAVENGKTIALANKESLVMAGENVHDLMKKTGAKILPIDSEHSAILQSLNGEDYSTINKIILTASGGPFRDRKDSLENVTITDALAHPNWSMGDKISIDSATMMNKGFELIEAVHLFDLKPEHIEIIIHPESIIHSMVEFIDGSVIAQLGLPDMMLPIQYALTYPDRKVLDLPKLNLHKLGTMNFFDPDRKLFPAIDVAIAAINEGGTVPVVLNAVNEIMVYKFLQGKIKFTDIVKNVEEEIAKHKKIKKPSIDQIFEVNDEIWKRLH
ncbi:MAG: 1-deoxy-D-xylulose-5-phosphate reductoisomerase [Candidatus Delongbacteria bacterium]|jgi:1-deoxy-D-xylulose-5-phosphate reductoisomerase|nr:1-deoxy-D-xylulose-5-phosphate reductoisomerase [Candidatus Delongbacteria bacterium]